MFILTSLILVLTVIYLFISNRKPKKFPPGPGWLPIVGSAPLIKRLSEQLGGKHKAFECLNQLYQTNVLGLRLGQQRLVIVSSYPLIKQLLAREEFEGRPFDFFIYLRCLGTRKGITMTDGEFSKNQRKFVKSHLRHLGFGKKYMENLLQAEVSDLLRVLKENEREPVEFNKIMSLSVINVLWDIVAGTKMCRDEQKLVELLDIMKQRSSAFDLSGGILNQFPWLRFIAPEAIGYNFIQRLNKKMKLLIMDTINEHKATWTEGNNDDFIYSYISAMKDEVSKNNRNTPFTEEQLLMVCVDLFIAGSVSTSITLDFIFLMMILHPDVQRKVQIVIDAAFKHNEEINYSDRNRVPYVEAVIYEVIRHCQVAPLGGPRRATCDTELDGYNIPKDTTILYSIYSLHNTNRHCEDPEVFRPERFLDQNGNLVQHEWFIPFSIGPRRCLGEALARSFMFTFFCETIRKYDVSVYPGTPSPTGKLYPGWFCSPENYKAQIVRRV